ncbi:NRDE family protein [Halorussus halobius]|uniref:NRDE family protein n=1 Tax=Halorussus halobius TaxID=1710537 RepID=UPI001092E6C5|nr:NRDE family protein [Halorussus halobius]
MCTLALAWRVFDETPIAVAANRDEARDRPSRPPRVFDGDPTVVAPRDEAAGGTWLGYNDAGLFVAVTNRPTSLDGERSRGLLVRDALDRASAAEAGSFVRNELGDRSYAGFNLVVADASEAALFEWDGVLRTTHFEPGVHVVVEAGSDASAPKAGGVRTRLAPAPETTAGAWFDRAGEVMADHDLGVCVHGRTFGTRSSSLVGLDADGDARYWFADGRPCETDYELVEGAGEPANSEHGPSDGSDGHL